MRYLLTQTKGINHDFGIEDRTKLKELNIGARFIPFPTVEINTIADLMNIINAFDEPIILSKEDDNIKIEIYNGWR